MSQVTLSFLQVEADAGFSVHDSIEGESEDKGSLVPAQNAEPLNKTLYPKVCKGVQDHMTAMSKSASSCAMGFISA